MSGLPDVSEKHQSNALWAILKERKRQDEKWEDQSKKHPILWLTILMEEVGELAKAILEEKEDDIDEEAVQVAAVAFAFLEARSKKGRQIWRA